MGIKDIIEILISLLISVLVIGYSFFETKSIKYYENNIHNGEWKENSQRIEKTRTEVIYTDDISDFDVKNK